MPITFSCSCGKTLRVNDDLAGKRARCPACQAAVTIPAADPGFEVVEDAAPPPPRRATPVLARPAAKPPAPPPPPDDAGFDVVDDEDDGRGYKAKAVNARRLDEDAAEERRRARRRRKDDDRDDEDEYDRATRRRAQAKESKLKSRSYEHRVINGGMMGGLAAMAIAAVWFIVGLALGVIFFYPPILFVIGLVGFIKGMVSRND